MPTLIINTNVSRSKVPATFVPEMSKIVAKELGKPESYVAVLLNTDLNLIWGGTDQPAAICSLSSIGKISCEQNKKTSKAIQTAIENHLGILNSRQYLVFEDLNKENVGFQGTTFDDLL